MWFRSEHLAGGVALGGWGVLEGSSHREPDRTDFRLSERRPLEEAGWCSKGKVTCNLISYQEIQSLGLMCGRTESQAPDKHVVDYYSARKKKKSYRGGGVLLP